MIHAPAATKKKKKVKAKASKGQPCVLEPKKGRKYLRGERDTVVDGYQAVEHESCFFSLSRPFKLAVVINGFVVRTYELAESIGIGILVDGR